MTLTPAWVARQLPPRQRAASTSFSAQGARKPAAVDSSILRCADAAACGICHNAQLTLWSDGLSLLVGSLCTGLCLIAGPRPDEPRDACSKLWWFLLVNAVLNALAAGFSLLGLATENTALLHFRLRSRDGAGLLLLALWLGLVACYLQLLEEAPTGTCAVDGTRRACECFLGAIGLRLYLVCIEGPKAEKQGKIEEEAATAGGVAAARVDGRGGMPGSAGLPGVCNV